MDSEEKSYLEARLYDAVKQCQKRSVPKFVGFLDAAGAAMATRAAKSENAAFRLFGGFSTAERVYFGVFPEWCDPETADFPIVKLRVVNKSDRKLSHRDILGALMSAGIERDTVGDIVTGSGDAVIFLSDSVAEHIKAEITKIASAGVELIVDETEFLPEGKGFSGGSDTVASPRLDAVVAALCNTSRSKAAELIEGGLVAVNGLQVEKLTKEVSASDVITVRHYGKFIIDSVADRSKKGRTILKYKKYK